MYLYYLICILYTFIHKVKNIHLALEQFSYYPSLNFNILSLMNYLFKKYFLATFALSLCFIIPLKSKAEEFERPFHMGFTPFHFSWNEERLHETYELLNKHSDLIAHHFEEGVPWPEALSNERFHPKVEKEIALRKKYTKIDKKVFVSTTAINFDRDAIADYWQSKSQKKLPKDWRNLKLDDPKVITAYTNFCKRLIEEFNPNYFVYGIEVNLLAMNNEENFERFKTLAKKVYPELKKSYPSLPISLSFYIHPPEKMKLYSKHIKSLLPYTDIFAVSTYPYMGYEGDGFTVENIPPNWLKQTRALAPGKPFAIAETGYIAEDLKAWGHKQPGSPEAQKQYTKRLLSEASKLEAEFVIWFVVADYDSLWGVLKWVVMFNPLFKAWKDTGLYDGDLNPRPALEVWDRWLDKPVY